MLPVLRHVISIVGRISTLNLRTLFIFACFAPLFYGATALAQGGNSDRCEVISLDVTGKKPAQCEHLQGKQLGTFDTVIAEEQLTTKMYRLPKTKLFVVASVLYTDESMASKKGADSISLQLSVSTKRKRDILKNLVYSDAEVPLNGFDVGRVTAMIKTGRRTFMLMMECKEHIRR